MKKCFIILLIITHLFSTVGFSMGVHECGGEKSFTVFGFALGHPCECDHEQIEHKAGCCKDKKVVIKADNSNKYLQKIIFEKQYLFNEYLPIIHFSFVAQVCFQSVNKPSYNAEHPPNFSPPFYILYNVFRI